MSPPYFGIRATPLLLPNNEIIVLVSCHGFWLSTNSITELDFARQQLASNYSKTKHFDQKMSEDWMTKIWINPREVNLNIIYKSTYSE